MSPRKKKTKSQLLMIILGVVFLSITFLMLIGLVIAAVFYEKEVPEGSKFLVVSIIAISTGIGTGTIGGQIEYSSNGILSKYSPIRIGAGGGLATMTLLFLLGYLFYIKPEALLQQNIAEVKTTHTQNKISKEIEEITSTPLKTESKEIRSEEDNFILSTKGPKNSGY